MSGTNGLYTPSVGVQGLPNWSGGKTPVGGKSSVVCSASATPEHSRAGLEKDASVAMDGQPLGLPSANGG